MTVADISVKINELRYVENWSLQLLQIKFRTNNATPYFSREIQLKPHGRLKQYATDTLDSYTNSTKMKLNNFENVCDYDGSANGKTIYMLPTGSELIAEECKELMSTTLTPDVEIDPIALRATAYPMPST